MSDRKNTLSRANIPDWAFVLYAAIILILFTISIVLIVVAAAVLLEQLLGVLCG